MDGFSPGLLNQTLMGPRPRRRLLWCRAPDLGTMLKHTQTLATHGNHSMQKPDESKTFPAQIVGELLRTERQNDGTRVLLRDLIVEVESKRITVPTGTQTDFSTIPWFGRILVRWSRVDIAGVVHDFLYHTQVFPRSKADRIWRLCAVSGEHRANWFQGWTGWLALRIAGWVAWNACKRRIESGDYHCR